MKKYIILESRDADRLCEIVEQYLSDKWSLQGGVSVTVEHDQNHNGDSYRYYTYYQAVTK